MNEYQPIYDAVRSRLGSVDVGAAIESAIRDASIGFYVERGVAIVAEEHTRPSVLYRPRLSVDGNQRCALYGENLRDGVAGFGDSPAAAMAAFDAAWGAPLITPPTE